MKPEVGELFSNANYAHLTTLREDGSPQARPVWTTVRDGQVAFFTQASSPKAANLARDGRVALSVVDNANPFRSAWIRGHVAGTIEGDDALTIIDGISEAYTGQPFPWRSGVVYLIEVDADGFAELPFVHAPRA